MAATYDNHYQTENLFGEPYPELIEFFTAHPKRGKVLDLGCGQGRDALALARLGYSLTGVDSSRVGIAQMNRVARMENLNLIGHVGDIYAFDDFEPFDVVLLDSMFHFAQKDKAKEVGLIQRIISKVKSGCLIVVCIQDTGDKVPILNRSIDAEKPRKRLADKRFRYVFEDRESGHTSAFDYRMIVIEK